MFTLVYCNFSKSQGGKIQTEKESAFQLAEERRKDRGFGLSYGWPVGPVSANPTWLAPCEYEVVIWALYVLEYIKHSKTNT